MEGIKFVDTTIRDGHQSLWAENMTTGMMLPVAEALDRAGFDAIELISSSHLKKCVRELKEDPWARVKLMSKRITHTPLRLNAGRFSAFDLTPRSMYWLFMRFRILARDGYALVGEVCRPLTKPHQKRASRGAAILTERGCGRRRRTDWRRCGRRRLSPGPG